MNGWPVTLSQEERNVKQDGHSPETITHVSLCSGYEGIGLGLRRVLPNLREIAYVEREGFPVANLVAKMEAGKLDAAPVFTDVKSFPYQKFRGCVDILSGGFPCQPFSTAGKREGVEDPRHLFPFIRDGIRECQPGIVFLENVEGIISAKTADGQSVLQYVLRELESLGYRATAGVFSAAEVGAPHQRKRVFILASNVENAPITGTRNLNRETEGRTGRRKGIRQGDGETGPVWTNSTGAELANGLGSGLEGHGGDEHREGRQGTGQSRPVATSSLPSRWPSRPGEPQYEWEEPRVVFNFTSEKQAERKLGRASHGSSARLDRLRLLGNGVVPDTAAKAFATLLQSQI